MKIQNSKFKILLLGFFLITFLFPPSTFASVVINEILPHPSSGDDWIELYKTESSEVDISGWKLEDSTSVMKTFSDGTKIASSASFLQVSLSNRLNNGGDTVKLKDKNDNLIDEKSYSSDPGTDVSLGRYPDGNNNWGVLLSVTPNGSNSNFVPTSTSTPTLTPSPVPTSIPTSSPSNTPVPTATPQPTGSPTTRPSVTPTKKPGITPRVYDPAEEVITPREEPTGAVLGEATNSADDVKEKSANNRQGVSLLLLLLLLGGGVGCIAGAVILSAKQIRRQRQFNP